VLAHWMAYFGVIDSDVKGTSAKELGGNLSFAIVTLNAGAA
jgi:hypothetical protein